MVKLLSQAMAMIRETEVAAPVKIGAVLMPNVFGTQLVATKEIR